MKKEDDISKKINQSKESLKNEPFLEYQSKSNTSVKITGGKQKKHSIAGVYTNTKNKKKYYIKKTMDETVTDDVAEILFPIICRAVLPKKDEKLIANCLPAIRINPKNKKIEMFVASEIAKNWKALHNFGMLASFNYYYFKVAFGYKTIPERIRDDIKKANCDEDLYKVLSLCALFNEYDIGPQNIGLSDNKKLVKIDHGWALTGIATKENQRIAFHDTLYMYAKRSPDTKYRVTPTNHLRDWIDKDRNLVIDSTPFADTMLQIVKNIKSKGGMQKIVKNSINNLLKIIKEELKKNKVPKKDIEKFETDLIKKLIVHTGVSKPKNSSDINLLKETLLESLTFTMKTRIFSMSCSAYVTKAYNLNILKPGQKNFDKDKILENLNLFSDLIINEEANRLKLRDTNDLSLVDMLDSDLINKYKSMIYHLDRNFDHYLKHVVNKYNSNVKLINSDISKFKDMLKILTTVSGSPSISKSNINKLDNVYNDLKNKSSFIFLNKYVKSKNATLSNKVVKKNLKL